MAAAKRGLLEAWPSRATPESAQFLGSEEPLPAAPPIAADAKAGIAAFGPVPVDLGLAEDYRQNRQRAIGGGGCGAE